MGQIASDHPDITMSAHQIEPSTEKASRHSFNIEQREKFEEVQPRQEEVPFPQDRKKKVLLKMDVRIVPLLMMLYRKVLDAFVVGYCP